MRVELDIRNVPTQRIWEYVALAGGVWDGEERGIGVGWTIERVVREPVRIGVMNIPRDSLVIEGDTDAVDQAVSFLRKQLMRGGG
jgi:hypothetical protein